MNIANVIMKKYPGALERGDVVLSQDEEGPIYISSWNLEGVDRPLEADLEAEADAGRAEFEANEFVTSGRRLLGSFVDSQAQARGYDSGVSCASYANSSNSTWTAEANAFIAWRDSVYAYAHEYERQVLDGSKTDYSILDFEAGVPQISWPEGV